MDETCQVNSSCEKISDIKHKSWFVLPPLMEYYYKRKNPFYKSLPSFRLDCLGEKKNMMDFVYPKDKAKIYLPKGFDGLRKSLVLSLAHNMPDTKVYWYINEKYIGQTTTIHEQSVEVLSGVHVFTVLDEFGNELKINIEILE